MKKFLAIFLLLTSCQSAEYSSGDSLFLDGSAEQCKVANECENLGWARLDNGVIVELQPEDPSDFEQVRLVFKQNGEDLGVQPLEVDSMIGTANWFELRVYFLDSENIYVWNRSGEEFTPGNLWFYNGIEWKDLDLVENVKKNLPEEYQSEDFTVRDILISDAIINVSVTIGDDIQYLELVNYILEFDRVSMELVDSTQNVKPL